VDDLVNTFRPGVNGTHPISEIVLVPSRGGRYEVSIDGELVFSKAETGQHTTNEHILDLVRQRL
jgi:selenoprotein W-related protein